MNEQEINTVLQSLIVDGHTIFVVDVRWDPPKMIFRLDGAEDFVVLDGYTSLGRIPWEFLFDLVRGFLSEKGLLRE